MGNRFEASAEASNQPANSNYWTNIVAETQQRQTRALASTSAPWLPSYEATAQAPGSAPWCTDRVASQDAPPTQRTQNPFDLISAAEASLGTNGMTADTKALYQKAIASADSLYNPQDLKTLQTLTDVLTTGKKLDGTDLAPGERMRAHQILDAELQAAQLGVQFRLSYAAMLQKTHQFATCESTLKEAITAADRMPQDLVRKEQQLLQRDVNNSSLSREQQILLGETQKDFIGNKSLQQPGFAYLPTLTRLEAAMFYVSAQPREDHKTPNGVLKPELSLAMLDSAKTAYQRNFNADISKKGTDPLYDSVAATANAMLPENLKKMKENTDGFWSDTAVNLAVAGLTFAATALIESRIHINPFMLKLGLATEAGLTATGQIARGGLMLGGATVGRHYGHELLTGNSESWITSTINGGAGLAEIGIISGLSGKLANPLFRGATEESALLRIAETRGTEGALTSGALKDLYVANNWAVPKSLSALDASTVIVKEGAVVQPLGLGLDAAKSAELTKAALTEAAGPKQGFFMSKISIPFKIARGAVDSVATVVNPRELDLSTATARQIAARGNLAGYVSALAGSEGYRAITSLDRKYDITTGDRISYAQSFANNMLSAEPFVDALMIMPFAKPGAMASNYYREGAGAKNAWGSIRNVFSHLGPSGLASQSESFSARTAALATPTALGSARLWQGLESKIGGISDDYQDLLDQQAGR